MSVALDNVRFELRRVIAHFKFKELEVAVLPSFPELTWKRLKSLLVRNHQNFTVSACIQIIEQTIKDAGIRDNDLRDRLLTLKLMDISRHSSQKVWTCYEMRDSTNASTVNLHSDKKIQEIMNKAFLKDVEKMDVRVTSHDSITFVSVNGPKISRRKIPTAYFALFKGQNYFFAAKSTVYKDYLMAMTHGLGYTSNKLVKLSGKDLKSLMKLLQAKKQGTINGRNVLDPPQFTTSKPVMRSNGIDFTQVKQRGEYVDKCFGTEAPKTELLCVNLVGQRWECSHLVPEMKDELVDIKLSFHSRYIPGLIKELAQRRVLQVPLPEYAEKMLIVGRNEMTFH